MGEPVLAVTGTGSGQPSSGAGDFNGGGDGGGDGGGGGDAGGRGSGDSGGDSGGGGGDGGEGDGHSHDRFPWVCSRVHFFSSYNFLIIYSPKVT